MHTAMRERDREVLAALRFVLAALDNAEAVPISSGPTADNTQHIANAALGHGAGDGARRELDDAAEHTVVADQVAELRASAAEYEQLGAGERGAELRRAAELIEIAASEEGRSSS